MCDLQEDLFSLQGRGWTGGGTKDKIGDLEISQEFLQESK